MLPATPGKRTGGLLMQKFSSHWPVSAPEPHFALILAVTIRQRCDQVIRDHVAIRVSVLALLHRQFQPAPLAPEIRIRQRTGFVAIQQPCCRRRIA